MIHWGLSGRERPGWEVALIWKCQTRDVASGLGEDGPTGQACLGWARFVPFCGIVGGPAGRQVLEKFRRTRRSRVCTTQAGNGNTGMLSDAEHDSDCRAGFVCGATFHHPRTPAYLTRVGNFGGAVEVFWSIVTRCQCAVPLGIFQSTGRGPYIDVCICTSPGNVRSCTRSGRTAHQGSATLF